MLIKKLLFMVIIISQPFSFAQSFRITKVIETNLFELDNKQKVKFYGLFIPSRQDTNQSLVRLANEIYQWQSIYMLNRSFKIEFINKNEDDVYDAMIYRSYTFSDENLANRLLSLGYATLLTNINNNYHSQLINYQERAQKAGVGIWEQTPETIKNIDSPIFYTEKELPSFQRQYERPYIPLLAISVASFALAWDSFSSANDIQKTIDALKSASNKVDVSELESSKTRKSIVGVTCLVAGIVTTLFSFNPVEVKTNLQSISLSYRF